MSASSFSSGGAPGDATGFLRRDELRADSEARGDRRVRVAGWVLLGSLLAATLVAAGGADRFAWPGTVGEEATYAMQAASLAYDLDLACDPGDRDRFAERWRMRPEGLVLQHRPGPERSGRSERAVYGRPFLYALLVAPFERLAPIRGPQIANALLLALAAVVAAVTLTRAMGAAAALWVAVLCYGSAAFAYVFRVTPDLFLMASVTLGFALVYGSEGGAAGRVGEVYRPPAATGFRYGLRWFAAGALLAVPAAYQPVYLVLLAPAALAVPSRRRGGGLGALVAGAAALLVVTALVQRGAGGGWTAFEAPSGERAAGAVDGGGAGVISTGAGREIQVDAAGSAADREAQPGDEPASEAGRGRGLAENLRDRLSSAVPADLDAGLDGRFQAWNALYLVAGRHVGLLPYFLPLLLPFAAAGGGRGRWALLAAPLAAMAVLSLLRPFDLFGAGPAAVADRTFLPLYPALWFLAGRRSRRSAGRAVAAVVLAALAGPFLWKLWIAPRAYPLGPAGHASWVAPLAAGRLPYETTQETIPGPPAALHAGIWVRSLNAAVAAGQGGALTLDGPTQADLLIAGPEALSGVAIDFGPQAPSKIVVSGAELVGSLFRGDGRVAFGLKLGKPRAVHPVWWRQGEASLYEVRFRLPEAKPKPLPFTVEPLGWSGG